MESLRYEGVVISFDTPEGFQGRGVLVHGSVGGTDAVFYVLIDEKTYEELLKLGIGQRVEGRGRKVSETPLVIDARG